MGPNLSTSAVEGEEEGLGKDERRGVSERARWCVCVCVCEREGGREGGREGERERERAGGGEERYMLIISILGSETVCEREV